MDKGQLLMGKGCNRQLTVNKKQWTRNRAVSWFRVTCTIMSCATLSGVLLTCLCGWIDFEAEEGRLGVCKHRGSI